MKKWILLLTIMLLLLLNSCFGSGYTKSENPNEYLTFELLDNGTYTVTGFSGYPAKNLVIPSTYKGVMVTEIAEEAFENEPRLGLRPKDIETVTIQDGIKIINSRAFRFCGATKYTLPNSIEVIGDNVFDDHVERKINFPNNLKKVGEYAFAGFTFQDELYLDGIELGIGAFYDTRVKKVTFSDYYTEIPDYLFASSKILEEVVLPDTCTKIGYEAFASCNLKNLKFGSMLSEFGKRAFANNSNLETIEFNAEKLYFNSFTFGNISSLKEISFNNTTYIENLGEAFCNSKFNNIHFNNVTNYYLDHGAVCLDKYLLLAPSDFNNFENTTTIEPYAFSGRNYDNITIPSGVTISKRAFYSSNINNLVVNTDSIYTEAFYNATINNLSISTKSIGSNEFYGVDDLKVIYFLEGVEEIGSEAFSCLFELETIYLPKSLKKISTAGFVQCHSLKEVFYAKEEGTPADLYAGSFIKYISNILTSTGQIDATINPELKIYVHNNIYDACVDAWSKTPTGEHYIYNDSLSNHIEIIK